MDALEDILATLHSIHSLHIHVRILYRVDL